MQYPRYGHKSTAEMASYLVCSSCLCSSMNSLRRSCPRHQYIKLDRCEFVCPSRMWRHFRNVYSGNEATTCTVTRTLGTSLLAVGTWYSRALRSRHTHSYTRATKARQTTLDQAKTVLSTSRTLSQATKVRLRYKRVDFLGTAKRNFQHVDLHRR